MCRPLAGTRWRGRTEEEDVALEADLLSDEKERAEHVMLVDLGRNDVGRVRTAAAPHLADCSPGSNNRNHLCRARPGPECTSKFETDGEGLPTGSVVAQVSVAGSVSVDRLMEVERYSHVMHISSTVTGKLLPELGVWDVLRAALPAGTVSGAPKVRGRVEVTVQG